MYNPYSLVGKTILVTGASSGIGQETAIQCSKLGASVILNGRNIERLNETLTMMEGDDHFVIEGDIVEEKFKNLIVEKIPELDGIVHCAGINKNKPFQFATLDALNEIMQVNFFAPTEISRLLIKKKKLKKGSSIVFVSSVSGVFCSAPASSMYSASKGAINGIVKGMALDLAHKNIRVNSVTPGVVETHIFDSGVISDEQLQENMKQYPLRRFGRPRDIALAIIYLLSDASEWVTGSNLLIDGGLLLQ